MREINRERHAHCINCKNGFVYDQSEWPQGIEPEYCPICMAEVDGSGSELEIETNWLTAEESAASNIKTRAQEAYINGEDPISVYLDSKGYNGIKELVDKHGQTSCTLHEKRLEYTRKNLIAGIPPFKDPRSNPRVK